jgi:DNA ligase-1
LKYSALSDVYEKIEKTTKRLEMTDFLVTLLKNTPQEVLDKVVYLTQGKIYPDFVDLEIGIAEKLAMKAIARATGRKEDQIKTDLEKTGDLGETTEFLVNDKKQATLFHQSLTVLSVYETFERMAKAAGPGSIDLKISLLAGLLSNASPKEGRYIIRTVTGNLRLGIAAMTVLDGLAIAFGGGKEHRDRIERAYNISSDLGKVAITLAEKGLKGVTDFRVSIGNPIRPMMAERLSSPLEILEKLGGKCAAEYKYDGERIQAHKQADDISLFSRRLEKISNQYPDAIELLKRCVLAEDAILEAECVAVNPDTGEILPFQELMHRRRKHDIAETMKRYPVALFLFDALYINGEDLTTKPYPVRRQLLEQSIREEERIRSAEQVTTDEIEVLENFFTKAVEEGCEGLVCKSIASNSIYQAGARGWLWIKYKRDYKSEMTDSVDLVIVGAFHGKGRRAGNYGALLLAAYNPKENIFETVTRCGTGFTDEDLEKLPKMMHKQVIPQKHLRVRSKIEADIWFQPYTVIEIQGAEITLSPVHVCAIDVIRKGSGLAIRFPRFTGNYRIDKGAEDATTNMEIVTMYKNQFRKMEKNA